MRTLFLTLCLLIFTFTCQARPDNLVFLSADALVKTRQALQKHQADALTETRPGVSCNVRRIRRSVSLTPASWTKV